MIKVSPELKKVINCITYKDLERACTISSGRIPSMVRKITDPTKKIGRIAALALFNRINDYINSEEPNDITNAFDRNLIIPKIKDQLASRREEVRKRFWEKYGSYIKYYDNRKDLNHDDLEFPEWDKSILGDYDITISSLGDLPFPILELECPEFTKIKPIWAKSDWYYFGPFEEPDIDFPSLYEHYKRSFYDNKEKYLKFRSLTLELKDKDIFSYLDKVKITEDKYKDHFLHMIKNVHSFENDHNCISPAPIGKVFDYYHSNFINWIRRTYNINLGKAGYNYYNSSEYPFLDDDSALIALQLRGTGIFEKLLKVARTGVSFTLVGIFKYWYDCTKDIANNLGVNCELSLLDPYMDYRDKRK